ncbi:RNA recognition motif domain [Dillenia turbinata]|uniref:RNA recognition motif domain n=1 Tax=Dillenia turbinata TaxID=194707 RepID=A0AAN8YTE1_9MAGN
MAPVNKSVRQMDQKQSHKDSEAVGAESNNLWVGNLTADVTDSDLMELFGKYGALDNITSYSSRGFAFVYFKRMEDARAAKDALQGAPLRGNSIKIELARPAKQSKHLWVGGFGPSVTKEKLEEEFLRFGKIEDFKFLRDRNTAFVDYFRLEDACQAMKSMNGKRIGGDQIRVDYLRSQPLRREQWHEHAASDAHFPNRSMGPDSSWAPQGSFRSFSESGHSGPKQQQPFITSSGRRGEGQPSKVLWVGYPPSVQIDEQMLHNAMILFGEIERIKSFPSRHYSFVEFRSVDEARRAKEGLQGRLFNDPRISIMFSSSELAPGRDLTPFYPGIKGPQPEIFSQERPYGAPPMEMFNHGRPIVSSNFNGPPPDGILGRNMMMRPFGPREPLLPAPEFNDIPAVHGFRDGSPKNSLVGNWRRPSPAPGVLPTPPTAVRSSTRPTGWDVYDVEQFPRELKRQRVDGRLPIDDVPFPSRNVDDYGMGSDQGYGGSHLESGGHLTNAQGKNVRVPADTRVASGAPILSRPDEDFIWRGVIAKGGTPVCHARCVPIGKGIDSEIPDVVNCSARTGLDLLAKHYADADGFDIVFFLPDSEEDFASYTEFLCYLGQKNRAGVAKLDDGTTLFLVPPSDFLTNILNFVGPERLYGVVLRLPQVPAGAFIQQQNHQPVPSPLYIDRPLVLQQPNIDRQLVPPQPSVDGQLVPLQPKYSLMPQNEQNILQADYNKSLHEESKYAQRPYVPTTSEPLSLSSAPQEYAPTVTAPISQAGVALTPDLIAALTSLLPPKSQPSPSISVHQPFGSTAMRTQPQSVAPDTGVPAQGWKQHLEIHDQTSHSSQQPAHQFNIQSQLVPHFQSYTSASNTVGNSVQAVLGGTQIRDAPLNLPQQGGISSWPASDFSIPSQSGQLTVPTQGNQQYQLDVAHNTQRGYGMAHGSDATSNGLQVSQETRLPIGASSELPNLQPALSGTAQGTSEVEADRSQRYQSTLQFAANLLLRIQQQQQQGNSQPEQGAGNQR